LLIDATLKNPMPLWRCRREFMEMRERLGRARAAATQHQSTLDATRWAMERELICFASGGKRRLGTERWNIGARTQKA